MLGLIDARKVFEDGYNPEIVLTTVSHGLLSRYFVACVNIKHHQTLFFKSLP